MERFSIILFVFLVLIAANILRTQNNIRTADAGETTEVNIEKEKSSTDTSLPAVENVSVEEVKEGEMEMSQEEWERKEKFEASKALFEKKCNKCHSFQRPLSKNKSLDGWKETVEKMQKKEPAWILPAEVEKITKYLAEIRSAVMDTTQNKSEVETTQVLDLGNK